MARSAFRQIDDGSPLCVPIVQRNWATSVNDTINVPRSFSGKPLVAIIVADNSQADKFLINHGSPGAGTDVYLAGVKRPFFVRDRSVDRDYTITPVQVYNTAGLDNTGGAMTEAAFNLTQSTWSRTYRGALETWGIAYGTNDTSKNVSNMGALLSLECWYGDYPRIHTPQRDDWDISGDLQIGTSTTTWRNIVAGRRDWMVDLIDQSGVGTLAWQIFGVNETYRNSNALRHRTSLAIGTGAPMSFAGLVHYDVIEIDVVDAAGPYNVNVRFTARD